MMDHTLRRMFDEADAFAAECDGYLDKRQRQSNGDNIIRKAYGGDQPAMPAASPPSATMSAEQQKPWDQWAQRIAYDEAMGLCELLGAETGKILKKMNNDLHQWTRRQIAISTFGTVKRQLTEPLAEIRQRLERLEETVSELEARLADLEGSGDSNRSAPVIPLRGGHAA